MSDTLTVECPYIQGTVKGDNDEDDTFPLKPNHGYKVGEDHRGDLSVFYESSTKGAPPSVERASQLDLDTEARRYAWSAGTVLTLITPDGKQTPLKLGSILITNAEKTVRFPDSAILKPMPRGNSKRLQELRGSTAPKGTTVGSNVTAEDVTEPSFKGHMQKQ